MSWEIYLEFSINRLPTAYQQSSQVSEIIECFMGCMLSSKMEIDKISLNSCLLIGL